MAASDLSDTLKSSIQQAMCSPSAGNELIGFVGGGSGSLTISAARTFTGGVTLSGTNATITDVDVVLSATTGTKFGTDIGQKLAFYNSVPVSQPTSANQAAVASTAATTSTAWGYATSTQANAIVTLVNQLRSELVTLGLIKGS